MPILFRTMPGAVVRLNDPAVQCAAKLLTLKPNISFNNQLSIVTRVTVSHQVNVQFLHTLGAQIYIYVFGDRIGTIGLSGLAFSCDCINDTNVGAENMFTWYKTNRVSANKAPVQVSLGNTAFYGFVVGFNEDVVDPSINLVQWGATLMVLPDN